MVLMSLLFMGGIATIFAYWLQMESRQTGRKGEMLAQQKAMESIAQAEIREIFHSTSTSYTWTNLPLGVRTYIIDGVTVTATVSAIGVP